MEKKQMSKDNKKTIIVTILIAAAALILIGVFTFFELKESGIILMDKEVKETMNDFDKYFNSKKKTVIYYASSQCSYCELETPILETIAKDYDMDYLYIDVYELPEKQKNEIIEKLGIEGGTPTTVIVKNGEVIDVQEGYAEGSDYVEFFKENGLVPDDAVYSEEAYITFIDYSDYEKIVANSDTNIVVLGQTTCSHCIATKPALNRLARDYNLTVNYLNINKMEEDEYNSLVQSLKDIGYDDSDFLENSSLGTPLTLVIKEGKVIGYISGERTKSQFVKELKKLGVIE